MAKEAPVNSGRHFSVQEHPAASLPVSCNSPTFSVAFSSFRLAPAHLEHLSAGLGAEKKEKILFIALLATQMSCWIGLIVELRRRGTDRRGCWWFREGTEQRGVSLSLSLQGIQGRALSSRARGSFWAAGRRRRSSSRRRLWQLIRAWKSQPCNYADELCRRASDLES